LPRPPRRERRARRQRGRCQCRDGHDPPD
jgi:hypothetical protein